MRGVATSVASASSSARTRNASRSSEGEIERTRTPRFGSKETRPSAARRRSASRTGVRLTSNRSDSCSCRSTVPGAIAPGDDLVLEDAGDVVGLGAGERGHGVSVASRIPITFFRIQDRPIVTHLYRLDRMV